MPKTAYAKAVQLLEAAHAAWAAADMDALLRYFTDDLEYQINAGTEDGRPLHLIGKAEFDDFWRPLMTQMTTRTSPGRLVLSDNVGRVQVDVWLKHRLTGFVLTGSYRQILTFRGELICRIEEYHDAAKLNAFWSVVAAETAKADGAGPFRD